MVAEEMVENYKMLDFQTLLDRILLVSLSIVHAVFRKQLKLQSTKGKVQIDKIVKSAK